MHHNAAENKPLDDSEVNRSEKLRLSPQGFCLVEEESRLKYEADIIPKRDFHRDKTWRDTNNTRITRKVLEP